MIETCVSEQIILMKLLVGEKKFITISVYAAQYGLSEDAEDEFYDRFIAVISVRLIRKCLLWLEI